MGLQLFGKGYPRLDTTNRVSAHYLETDVVCGKHGIIGRKKKRLILGIMCLKDTLEEKSVPLSSPHSYFTINREPLQKRTSRTKLNLEHRKKKSQPIIKVSKESHTEAGKS